MWCIHIGVPCKAWSTARQGITHFKRPAEVEHASLEFALFTAAIARECVKCCVLCSLENPLSSKSLNFEPILEVASLLGASRHLLPNVIMMNHL